METSEIVYVIGAAGHVGLPFCVVTSERYDVVGIDLDIEKVNTLNATKKMPYIEENSDSLYNAMTFNGLKFVSNYDTIHEADHIVIMIGTPVDEEGNANIRPLLDLTNTILVPLLTNNDKVYNIILRSTVSPGTTETIRDILEKATRKKEGEHFVLSFCPERVAQGRGIIESKSLPQLVGSFSVMSGTLASMFFWNMEIETVEVTVIEAELAKLITNMYRYVNFALANEFQMIARTYGANASKIIEAANHNYDRMNMPMPGPNVGGPCLYKDGKFMLEGIPYTELIRSSFTINEGMPDYIMSEIKRIDGKPRKILIVGAAFKANNDDHRNSLSFKLRKLCLKNGIGVDIIDPFVDKAPVSKKVPSKFSDYDAVILMTPHTEYKTFLNDNGTNLRFGTLIVDLWNFWGHTKHVGKEIYRWEFLNG